MNENCPKCGSNLLDKRLDGYTRFNCGSALCGKDYWQSDYCLISQLRQALPDPEKLILLADWFDFKNPNDLNPEVQEDLRTWASRIRELKPPSGRRL